MSNTCVGRVYTCGNCGKTEPFGGEWRFPLVGLERGYYDRRVLHPYCSATCEVEGLAKPEPPAVLA